MPEIPLEEFGESFARAGETKPGDQRTCRRCGVLWQAGHWNFHDLCDSCFRMFDAQKMTGRWAIVTKMMGKQPEDTPDVVYYESVDEWMKNNPLNKE